METKRRIKVLMAKIGMDGHDRGAMVLCTALREAGMEVIYTGLHQSPESVAETALQEDVDVIGVSSLADAHRTLVPKLINELKVRQIGDIPVLLGGFIQPEDIPELQKGGITEVFRHNASLDEIITYIKRKVTGSTE
ncbi:cobalamin B12-binding domain-containing protein [Chloroflexota bacterium]